MRRKRAREGETQVAIDSLQDDNVFLRALWPEFRREYRKCAWLQHESKNQMLKPKKPKMFIGSSTQALPLVEHVKRAMKSTVACVPWNTAKEFSNRGSGTTIEALCETVEEYDFAMFLFTPDDDIRDRDGNELKCPRDNVVFEYGLFLSALGPQRVLAMMQVNETLKTPSDLLGVNMPRFTVSADSDYTYAEIDGNTDGFRTTIRDLKFRHISLGLASRWKFCSEKHHFMVKLAGSNLAEFKSRIGSYQLCIGARVENEDVNFDDDGLVYSGRRRLPRDITDIIFKIPASQFANPVRANSRIQGRVILVPDDVDLVDGTTMNEAIAARCRFVESVSYGLGSNYVPQSGSEGSDAETS